jgi:hypothetical protein
MPALCSGLERSESPEHSASPSLYLVQQAATDGPELTGTSGPRLLAKLTLAHCLQYLQFLQALHGLAPVQVANDAPDATMVRRVHTTTIGQNLLRKSASVKDGRMLRLQSRWMQCF